MIYLHDLAASNNRYVLKLFIVGSTCFYKFYISPNKISKPKMYYITARLFSIPPASLVNHSTL